MGSITQDINATLGFKNEHIIYEHEIRCKVNENEFNISHNPTLTLDNLGTLISFTSSSDFTPYVTTIGLYNNRNELLAVAKLAQPTPLSSITDTTFIIKYTY